MHSILRFVAALAGDDMAAVGGTSIFVIVVEGVLSFAAGFFGYEDVKNGLQSGNHRLIWWGVAQVVVCILLAALAIRWPKISAYLVAKRSGLKRRGRKGLLNVRIDVPKALAAQDKRLHAVGELAVGLAKILQAGANAPERTTEQQRMSLANKTASEIRPVARKLRREANGLLAETTRFSSGLDRWLEIADQDDTADGYQEQQQIPVLTKMLSSGTAVLPTLRDKRRMFEKLRGASDTMDASCGAVVDAFDIVINATEQSVATADRSLRRIKAILEKYVARSQADQRPLQQSERLTLRDLFKAEYSSSLRSAQEATLESGGIKRPITLQAYFDFEARSKFVGYFIPSGDDTFNLCSFLVERSHETLDGIEKLATVKAGFVGQRDHTTTQDLVFTAQVVIYHETELSTRQAADLGDLYRAKGLALVLRGPEYLSMKRALRAASESGRA